MDIFEKIESMYEKKDDNETYNEILKELKEIKNILKMPQKQYTKEYRRQLPKEYFEFVKQLRIKLTPNPRKGIEPHIAFEGMILGVKNGLLFDKQTQKYLPTYKAYYVYEKLFFEYKVKFN